MVVAVTKHRVALICAERSARRDLALFLLPSLPALPQSALERASNILQLFERFVVGKTLAVTKASPQATCRQNHFQKPSSRNCQVALQDV